MMPAERTADPAALMLGRAYALVLSWPCRVCGQPGRCQCQNETAVVDTFAGQATTAADSDKQQGATHHDPA